MEIILLKDFPSTHTDCNLVSVSSESLNENHLFEKYSVTDSLSNMVEKGYFIGDSLLFTAITIGVIVVFGIFLRQGVANKLLPLQLALNSEFTLFQREPLKK